MSPECALPDHLKDKLHNDYWWPFSMISRAQTAYGPRCPLGSNGSRPWPPKLIEGKGIVRWESNFANTIIYIPELANKYVTASDVYGHQFEAITQGSGVKFNLTLNYNQYTSWDEIEKDEYQFHPSALQKTSPSGWMRLDPYYYSQWKILKQREFITNSDGEDTVLFYRSGYRPDSLDLYYNKSVLFTAGLHWE